MKNRKLFMLLFALALIVSLSVSAFAVENDLQHTMESSDSIVFSGGTVSVTVSITQNTGFSAASADLYFDPAILTYESSSVVGSAYENVGVNAANEAKGFLGINIGTMEQMFTPGLNYVGTGKVATITFSIKAGYEGKIDFTLKSEEGYVFYPDNSYSGSAIKSSLSITCIDKTTHQHTKQYTQAVAGSCIKDAYAADGWTCTVCGESQAATNLGKQTDVHNNTTTVAGYPAECDKDGLTEGTKCLDCNKMVVEQKPNTDRPAHNYETVKGYPAECDKDGLTNGTKCKHCGEWGTQQTAITQRPAHDYQTVEGEPATCTTAGKTDGQACTACGYVKVAQNVIPALGHNQEELVKGYDATCTTPGKTDGYNCSRCHITAVMQQTIPAKGHTPVEDNKGFAATCTVPGQTNGTYCSVCNETISAPETIPALGHDKIVDAAGSATCTTPGTTDGWHCSRCDYKEGQSEVPALGHDIVIDKAVAATCNKTGLTEGKHCSRCDYKVAQETVPVDPDNHKVVTDAAVDATCTATGLTEGSHCSRCEKVLKAQETLPMLEHEYVLVVGKPSTCTEAGYSDTYVCSCGALKDPQAALPLAPHTEVVTAGKAPTCTEDGYTESSICDVCKAELVKQETIEATGHTFGEWTVTKEATEKASGEETRTCSCGETETREISKLPASFPWIWVIIGCGAAAAAVIIIIIVGKKRF